MTWFACLILHQSQVVIAVMTMYVTRCDWACQSQSLVRRLPFATCLNRHNTSQASMFNVIVCPAAVVVQMAKYAGTTLGQRLRRWPSVEPAYLIRVLLPGYVMYHCVVVREWQVWPDLTTWPFVGIIVIITVYVIVRDWRQRTVDV